MRSKRRILILVLAICFSLSINIHAVSGVSENLDVSNIQYSDCLDSYFAMRETQFNNSGLSTLLEANGESCCTIELQDSQLTRNEFIAEWENALNISVVEAEISYRVDGIYSLTESEVKLYVYEWAWIDYYCVGSDVLETMGFGTNHIITLCQESGMYIVACDSYEEITGYVDGQSEEVALLNASFEMADNSLSTIASNSTTFEPAELTATYSIDYDPSAAVSYAHTWCGNTVAGTSNDTQNPSGYNPLYYYYPTTNSDGSSTGWGDCANFVSQCIYAGGFSEDSTWYATRNVGATTPEADVNNHNSSAWRGATELKNYLVSTLGYPYTRITSSSQAIVGNLIYYSAPHIVIIVGTNSNGQVLIDGHTNDAYRYPYTLTNQTYYTICLQQICGTASSLTSTQHRATCKCGAHTWIESHSWSVLADGSKYCVLCGYMT